MVDFAYYTILGRPLVYYFGVVTYICFVTTAGMQIWNKYRRKKIAIRWHRRFAYISLGLATLHGLMGISVYL